MHSSHEDTDDDLAQIVATGERLPPDLVTDVISHALFRAVFDGVRLVDGEEDGHAAE